MSEKRNKLIFDIIELILEDMCCYHEESHDEDGVHTSVQYSLNSEPKLVGMIDKLIEQVEEKPKVSQEFVENMTNRMEQLFMQTPSREDREFFIQHEVLKDAGVEVDDA